MIIGFVIWSIVFVIFLGIGINCRSSQEAVGFFTFAKAPSVKAVKEYNRAVSRLWMIAAVLLELIGLPLLFAEQNSPLFVFVVFGVVALLLAMMIAYIRIEAKYKEG